MDSTQEYITKEQRVLSFCYGYGGLERGVNEILPIKPVAYLEIEAFQIFNLVSAMEAGLVDKAPVWTDLKTFDPKPFHNKVHGFIGGYPCQGESYAGKRKLWKDPRFLYPYIEKCIDTIRPLWCFFENVSGHLSGSFPYVLDSLRNMGYRVEAGLFTASEVGAPHQRKRLFILALDDTASHRWIRQTKESKIKDGNKRSEKNRKLQDGFERSNNELAYTCSERLQRNVQHKGNDQKRRKIETRSITKFSWPAEPGPKQKDWEQPRTIEPGLGSTINGYDFRTELLRQYGNGVVSQTASKSFEFLLDKHTNNHKL